MSDFELGGCKKHAIRVADAARDAWAGIPWSAEKNLIRKLCNDGAEFPLCPTEELDFQAETSLVNDPDWADPDKVPSCLAGLHYPRPPQDNHSILQVGFWIVLFHDNLAGDRSASTKASLRQSSVLEIKFMRDLLKEGLGLRI